jgi:hypothetical protein
MSGSILCLDLATQMGWAEGEPGEKPTSGTHRLAHVGASPAAVQGGLLAWLGARLTTFKYRMVIYEAPLDPRWQKQPRSERTARMLIGLCGITEAVAHQTGHRIMEANVQDVRKHLLGARPPTGEGKAMVMQRLRILGHEYRDDNEADALALWLYATAIANSRIAQMTTPLFAGPKK